MRGGKSSDPAPHARGERVPARVGVLSAEEVPGRYLSAYADGPAPESKELGAGPTVEQAETYASNTSRTSCSCSAWCRFAEPTAGDDECGREIRRSRSP